MLQAMSEQIVRQRIIRFDIPGGDNERENFIAAMDIGRSSLSTASIYMNIGYIF